MVRATFRQVTVGVFEPPDGVGFVGFLSRQPSGYEAIAEADTRTLAIETDAFVGILEDRFSLMYGGIR
jgi:CRP-like cAMP-binding protein